MPDKYFNTTNLDGEALDDAQRDAAKQDEIVYRWFVRHGSGSPSQVNREVLADAPLTSVRRSITTLTNRGLLRKTRQKVIGIYNKPEHVWTLAASELTKEEPSHVCFRETREVDGKFGRKIECVCGRFFGYCVEQRTQSVGGSSRRSRKPNRQTRKEGGD